MVDIPRLARHEMGTVQPTLDRWDPETGIVDKSFSESAGGVGGGGSAEGV